jgi:hypothetical protein
VTISVREYVAESAGTQRTKRKSSLKADFMATNGGLRVQRTEKRVKLNRKDSEFQKMENSHQPLGGNRKARWYGWGKMG